MKLSKMTKEDLELLSNKDITVLILEENKKSLNTKQLFEKIIELLELPSNVLENKIADYYTSLATDKRFLLLEDGTWDLRNRHTSDKVIKVVEDEDDYENESIKEEEEEPIEEESYDDRDESDYDDETNEELKDLVIIDEDELELEQ